MIVFLLLQCAAGLCFSVCCALQIRHLIFILIFCRKRSMGVVIYYLQPRDETDYLCCAWSRVLSLHLTLKLLLIR